MTTDGLKDPRSLSGDWQARLEELGAREGFYANLGPDHATLFVKRNNTLIVTFETARSIVERQVGRMPFGLTVSEMRNCSHLCLIAKTKSWYRDANIYAFFDSLVDESFFEDFDNVVFFGAGMAGYAAAAYSVAAPGATVVLLQPQATLDPAVTGWDPRHSDYRRLNFNDRYGYAPDMLDGAGRVYLMVDPEQTFDAMHAALFRKPFVHLLPCRNLGGDLFGALCDMHVLQAVLAACASGSFDPALFWTFYRTRRNYLPYLRKLLSKLEADGRAVLALSLARNVGARLGDEKFLVRAKALDDEIRFVRAKLGRGDKG